MTFPGAVVLAILSVLPTEAVADEWPVSRAPTVAAPLVTSDSLGRLTSVTTAEGTTRYDYFEESREPLIARITHPDGTSDSYTLDVATMAFRALSEPTIAGTSSSPCSDSNRFAFNGYLADCELGLYYTPSGRLYDPAVGRFLQQDSYLGETSNPPSLHRYAFGHNNPTSFVDPSGHESYRQWIGLDNASADVGHEFLKQFGYNAFNALSFGALARQDALVEQSEAGRISETRYQARTGVNLVGSSVAAAATIYTAGAAGSATAGALAPLTAATELGVPLLPAAAATIAGGAAGGGAAGLAGAALSDDLGMLTGTTSPLDVNPGGYAGPVALGAVTGAIFGAGAAAGVRPFGEPIANPPPSTNRAVVVGEGRGGALASEQVELVPVGSAPRPALPAVRVASLAPLEGKVPDAVRIVRNGGTVSYQPDGRVTVSLKGGPRVTYNAEGFPDFRPYLYRGTRGAAEVRIALTGSRVADEAAANAAAGFTRTPRGYTWHHHEDPGLMQLVETAAHRPFSHTGGFARRQRLDDN